MLLPRRHGRRRVLKRDLQKFTCRVQLRKLEFFITLQKTGKIQKRRSVYLHSQFGYLLYVGVQLIASEALGTESEIVTFMREENQSQGRRPV